MSKKKELVGIKIDDLLKKTFAEDDNLNEQKKVASDLNKEIKRLKNELKSCNKKIKAFDFIEKDDKELFKKGLEYDEKGDLPMAAFYYILAIKKNKKNIKALINLAIIYYEFDMEKRAEELFKKILEIDPENEIARENLRILTEEG